jgi:hypothetical protein
MTRIAIVGSRKYPNLPLVAATVASLVKKIGAKNLTIVSGGARGVDQTAEVTARALGSEPEVLNATWNVIDEATGFKRYNPGAGFERNTTIVEHAEMIIAFWDCQSTGTMDTVHKAVAMGKKVTVLDTEGKLVEPDKWPPPRK